MVDGQAFRNGMARFGSAVSIIATDGAAGRAGFTASAVTSVTDDPPTLLVCMNKLGHTNPVLRANGRFSVNVLAVDQRDLAVLFARSGAAAADRFADADWTTSALGSPLLRNALVAFECALHQDVDVGTHTVVFGRVQSIHHGALRPALAYIARGYRSLDVAHLSLAKAAE